MTPNPPVDRLVHYFEHLQPQTLAQLGDFYAPDALFKDPFNEIQGVTAITAVFEHMFRNLHEPRFVVTQRVVQGEQVFLTWDFLFHFKQFNRDALQTIRGATHLVFDDHGRVTLHRDYWDAAEELYEKLPWVRGLMRWLKRRSQS